MYRVLIVDDETLAVRYLSTLIDWGAAGFEPPATAMTAARALELFATQRFDVVLADVRMPEMDGVTLAGRMREINPDCKWIILTAYRDFEVVQRSVQTGVSAFLLKHEVDAEGLERTLRKTAAQLEDERRLRRAALSHYLAQKLSGGAVGAVPEAALAGDLWLQLTLLKAAPGVFSGGEIAESAAGGAFPVLAECRLHGGVHAILRAVRQDGEIEPLPEGLCENALRVDGARFHGLEALDDLGAARRLAMCSALGGAMRVTCGELMAMQVAEAAFPPEYESRAMEYLRAGSDALKGWVLSPLEALEGKALCRSASLAPLARLIEACRGAGVRLEGLEACKTLAEIVRLLRRDVQAAALEGDAGSVYAERAAEIIRQSYAQPLHTADIAGQLFISEGYLRAVFKRAYGCTLSEYLRQTRIEAACALLRSRKYRAYEIADMCGFANSQHFNQVFRQEKGMSPLRYAQLNGEKT